MKIVYVLLTMMLMTVNSFGQSLTSFEKEQGESLMVYYSGKYPGLPNDATKIEAFVYGDETAKKASVKAFIKDVVLPMEQSRLSNLQSQIAESQAKIVEYQNYIK